MMTDWGCKPPMKHHRKDGGSAENRQSLVSADCARVEAAGKMKCLTSNYDPDNPLDLNSPVFHGCRLPFHGSYLNAAF